VQSPLVARDQTPYGEPDSAAASLLPPFVSPHALALCVSAGLVLLALVAWLAVGVQLANMRQLHVQLSGTVVDPQQMHQVRVALRIAQAVQVAVFGLTALAFLAWLYRLRVNLRTLGVRKLEFARHWSVLGFLVPALNFVRPYQVMSEVWSASEPSVLDPFEWKSAEPPRILTLWWGSFVIAATLELAAFGFGQTAGMEAFRSLVASGIAVVADAATAVSASLAYFVVTRLTAAQSAKQRRLLAEDADA
jgi:hypothetical protein